MTGGIVLFLVLLNIPMLLRVIRVASPLAVDPTASHFTGRSRRWRITTVTGRVRAASTHTVTHGGSSVQGSSYSGTVTGHVSTDVYNNMRLQEKNGSQHDVSVRNFSAQVHPDDVATACWASKGRTTITFAILNHTTRQQYFNNVDLHKISSPHNHRAILWILISCLTIVGLPLGFIYWGVEKRQRRRFMQKGVYPLWEQTSIEARPLMTG